MDIWRRQFGSDHTADPTVSPPAEEHLAIGLALGGGAARGFAHIGVLRTLTAYGIRPEVIAGTSIGAVVGGFFAAGRLDAFEDWARQLTRRRMLGYLDFKIGGSGLIGGDRLADRLDDTIGEATFAETCRCGWPPSPPRSAPAMKSGSRAAASARHCRHPMRCRGSFLPSGSAAAG